MLEFCLYVTAILAAVSDTGKQELYTLILYSKRLFYQNGIRATTVQIVWLRFRMFYLTWNNSSRFDLLRSMLQGARERSHVGMINFRTMC
jgi:hypothetical protein